MEHQNSIFSNFGTHQIYTFYCTTKSGTVVNFAWMKTVNISIREKYKAMQIIEKGKDNKKSVIHKYGVKKNTISTLPWLIETAWTVLQYKHVNKLFKHSTELFKLSAKVFKHSI